MRRGAPRRLALLAVASLSMLGAACGDSDSDSDGGTAADDAEPGTVLVDDNVFRPETVEVGVGDTVTWDFVGATLHNVTGDGFKSKNLKDGTFEHTFNSAGSYEYVCTLHPGMNGEVIVG